MRTIVCPHFLFNIAFTCYYKIRTKQLPRGCEMCSEGSGPNQVSYVCEGTFIESGACLIMCIGIVLILHSG